MSKFTVDRQTWHRGKGGAYSKLLTPEGMRCCVGFVCVQVGIADETMYDREYIPGYDVADEDCAISGYCINLQDWKHTPEWLRYNKKSSRMTQAYAVNDAEEITEEVREQRLKEIFAEHGDEIEFIN